MHAQGDRSVTSRLLRTAHPRRRLAGLTLATLLWSAPLAAAPVDRLVIGLEPGNADTNLYWATAADVSLFPALGRLVGNDAATGGYSSDGLAESWEANDDFTIWTFHLHPDAEWHFGWGPVTAEDIAHSYALHIVDDSTQSAVAQLRGAELEIVDDHTIRFIFAEPRVDFLFAVASRGSMLIYSKAQYEAEGLDGYIARPAGTEHYQIVERLTGQHILFERVEDHWSGSDAAFPELELRWTAEPATKLAALLAGEIHITNLPRELQPEAVERGKAILQSTNPSAQITANFNGLYMRSGDPAFNPDLPWVDIRIREAMNRALDREQIVEVVYEGRATPLAVFGMTPNNEGYVADREERFEAEYGYDPARAKELLAEAGYPEAFADPVIPIVVAQISGNPELTVVSELMQVFFEEIGLETELREMDWAAMNAMGRGRQAYVVNPNRQAPIRPTEPFLQIRYTTAGSPNGGYETDEIQGLTEAMGATVDREERARIAALAYTYLFENYVEMPIAVIHSEMTVDPEVVAVWPFPGVTAGGMSHWHLIVPAEAG